MRRLVPYILVFLAGLLVGSCRGASPSSELQAAVNDLRVNVPRERWRTTRYLTLYNIPEKERESGAGLLGYVVNSVARGSVLRGIRTVHTAGGKEALATIDLADLQIPAAAWESLVSDAEPYFHITTKAIDPTTGKVQKVYTDAGHVGLEAAKQLRDMTGSGGAIVRADWFVVRALSQPHYYNLSGTPKTEKEWLAAGGATDKEIIDLRANKGSSIFRSGVTFKPRRISRRQTITGANWITRDSEEGDPQKHPIRVPGFDLKADASEAIAAKPNGLLAYALFNAKGELVPEVPPQIAKDSTAHDGRLIAPVSCVRCHDSTGFKPFANDFTALVKSGVDLHLPADELEQIASFYADNERLAKLLSRDQDDYEAAVSKATGGKFTANELSKVVARMYSEYVDDQVDQDKAKRELGVRTLSGFAASNDAVLLAILSGIRVNRADWEGSFPEAATLTK